MGSVNPSYAENLSQLKEAFAQDPDLPVVALGDVLTAEAFESLAKECADGWKHECIPDQRSYATRKRMKVQDELKALVKSITGKSPLDETNRRFAHRDFTLLHDDRKQKAGVIGLLFLEDVPESAGGSVVFVKKGETLGRFTPRKNTLLVVHRKRGVQCFVHYLNHRLGNGTLTVVSA